MKTLMIFAILVSVSLSSFNVVAFGDNENKMSSYLSVQNPSSGKYKVKYTSKTKENVSITIYNEKGQEIRTDHVRNKDGFVLPYDFNSLPEGTYRVNVKNKDNDHDLFIEHKKEAVSLKSYLQAESGKGRYHLKVIKNSNEPVVVSILDIRNKVLYTEIIDVDYNFGKVYDLSHLRENPKTISISSGTQTVNHKIN